MSRRETMALTLGDVREKIDQAKPDLLPILVLDVGLKAKLKQMGVITDVLDDQLQPVSLTPRQRIDVLLDDLKIGPVWRFLHFCKVMHEKGNTRVLEALEVDIDYIDKQLDIVAAPRCRPSDKKRKAPNIRHPASGNQSCRPQKRHFYQEEESDKKREIPAHLLPGLLEHCQHLERNLMQNRLFDFSDEVRFDLTELYTDTDVTVKQNEREKKKIEVREFFSKLFQSHAPKSLLLEGEVGSGKSSLLRQYAHNFCKEFLECHNEGPDVTCEGHKWKMVVYTPAGLINSSVEEAIESNIRCQSPLKSQLMNAISEDGDRVLLIKDGMDELHNIESVESIRKYTKDCQEVVGMPTILLSSRNGLSQIEKVLFDRIVKVEGFSPEQGLEYVERHFKVRYNLTDHPVLKHIKAHAKEVEWILRNPLQAAIFSELAACGELSLEDVKTLSRVKLLKIFETHILKRDQKCRNVESTQESTLQFYQLCLECLLKDQRTIRVNNIDGGSPHMAFLDKDTHTDLYANTHEYYSFGHEMLLEFFSIQGLIHCLKSKPPTKQAILLYLCANPKMRNSLLLTCGYVSEYEPELLDDVVFIIQACLIMQIKEKNCVMNQLTEGLLQLPAMILETFPPNVLTQGLTKEQASTAEDISQRIQRAFNQDAEQLRAAGWFCNGYSGESLRR